MQPLRLQQGPTSQTCGVLKKKDGSIIDDQMEKLKRWIEHNSELYGTEGNTCHQTLLNLPQSQIHNHLDDEPDIAEVLSIIESMSKGKAPGADELPSELLQAGLIPLASHLHQLILKSWHAKQVPQDFKDTMITTLYKNKGQREVVTGAAATTLHGFC